MSTTALTVLGSSLRALAGCPSLAPRGTALLSTSAAAGRWHKDKTENQYLRGFGYNDRAMNYGALPRISNDSPKIEGKKIFQPEVKTFFLAITVLVFECFIPEPLVPEPRSVRPE